MRVMRNSLLITLTAAVLLVVLVVFERAPSRGERGQLQLAPAFRRSVIFWIILA